MATTSIRTHMPQTIGRGKCSRQSSARLCPVAMPSFADRLCTSIAIRLLTRITHMRR